LETASIKAKLYGQNSARSNINGNRTNHPSKTAPSIHETSENSSASFVPDKPIGIGQDPKARGLYRRTAEANYLQNFQAIEHTHPHRALHHLYTLNASKRQR
jgi:hypothetical protein